MYSCNSSCFLKQNCSCDIRFAEYWFKTQSQEIKEIYIHMFFSLFYIFWYSRKRYYLLYVFVMYYNQQSNNLFLVCYDLQPIWQQWKTWKSFKNAKGEGHCSLIKWEQKVFLCLTRGIRVLGPFCWKIVPPLSAMICDWYAQ